MKVGLAQTNSWLGDFAGNRNLIIREIKRAQERECDLVVFPEAALFGYHPCDLLERPSVVTAQLRELKLLEKQIPKGIGVLVGAIVKNPGKSGKPYLNAAVFMERGKRSQIFAKQLLPTYDVFDEARHIEPGTVRQNILRFRGKKILITVCEDIWAWPHAGKPRYATYPKNPLLEVKKPIHLVINMSASPFATAKLGYRKKVTAATAKYFNCPLIYVNMVGAQDELIFDGASFVISPKGSEIFSCARFREDFQTVDLMALKSGSRRKQERASEVRRQALILGLSDFARKNGFSRYHLGLSGGIDSAVVACLAADAVGPSQVTAFGLPGPFSAPESLSLAEKLAGRLGLKWHDVSISELYRSMVTTLDQHWGQQPFGVMHENLQARIRSILLMAFANRERSLLLATSNKSELATGYSTLYGDMSGALMPLGDLLKHEVYEIAELYNEGKEIIPGEIIRRPPSAELRPNQRDQDSLPPYNQLDPAVEKLVAGLHSAEGKIDQQVLKLLMQSEFKRWQAAPILKVADHSFGRGRRLPLSHRAYY